MRRRVRSSLAEETCKRLSGRILTVKALPIKEDLKKVFCRSHDRRRLVRGLRAREKVFWTKKTCKITEDFATSALFTCLCHNSVPYFCHNSSIQAILLLDFDMFLPPPLVICSSRFLKKENISNASPKQLIKKIYNKPKNKSVKLYRTFLKTMKIESRNLKNII